MALFCLQLFAYQQNFHCWKIIEEGNVIPLSETSANFKTFGSNVTYTNFGSIMGPVLKLFTHIGHACFWVRANTAAVVCTLL